LRWSRTLIIISGAGNIEYHKNQNKEIGDDFTNQIRWVIQIAGPEKQTNFPPSSSVAAESLEGKLKRPQSLAQAFCQNMGGNLRPGKLSYKC
jgi:hypothetical protein